MGIMNIKDIVELAKAGYKPSDVKELIALTNQSDKPAEEKGDQKGQAEKTQQHDAGKEQPEEAVKNATVTPEKEDSSILSYKEKIQELEEKLQKLQSENVHKDQSEVQTKSDEELLNELTASYM